jgi:hypothetical protein
MIKQLYALLCAISLIATLPVFGMENAAPNQPEAQVAQIVCSICGQNDTPIQTITKNNTRTTDNGRWVYNNNYNTTQPSFKYKQKACKTCNLNWCVCYTYQTPSYSRSAQYVPQYNHHNTQCSHVACTACVVKSRQLYPNANGCNLCPYIQARIQHAHCNMCNNPVDKLQGSEAHNHGLCNQHHAQTNKLHQHNHACNICYAQNNPAILNQHQQCDVCNQNNNHINIQASCTHSFCDQHYRNALQFKYSPIDSIKEILQGNGCKSCFTRNNPDATSCETKVRYWGETALLIGGTSIVIYSAYKIYNWWQNRNQEDECESECATVAAASDECNEDECYRVKQERNKQSAPPVKKRPVQATRKTNKV